MNKVLKYFIICCVGGLIVFSAYVNWMEMENKKPTIYIDNYSGYAVDIKYQNKKWLQLDDKSSAIKRDLSQGTYFLYIMNINTSDVDTIRIDIQEKKNYVLNISDIMSYYEGEITYQKNYELKNKDHAKEEKISKHFFSDFC